MEVEQDEDLTLPMKSPRRESRAADEVPCRRLSGVGLGGIIWTRRSDIASAEESALDLT